MANHVRQQIRDAVKTLLTGLATTGANAYASRLYPLQDSELPAVLIDTVDGGGISPGSIAGASRLLERRMTLTITAAAKAVSGYQDTVDTILKEVEIALAGDNTLGGKAKWVQPAAEPVTELSDDGDQPVALAKMNFDVLYVTALNQPDVSL